jgi:hypothetical protein
MSAGALAVPAQAASAAAFNESAMPAGSLSPAAGPSVAQPTQRSQPARRPRADHGDARLRRKDRKELRRAALLGRSIIVGWTTRPVTVPAGSPVVDVVAVLTGGERRRRKVEVQRRAPGESVWTPVVRQRTDDQGRATLTFVAPAEGTSQFRVEVVADRKGRLVRSSARDVTAEVPEPTGVPLADYVIDASAPPQTGGPSVAVAGDIGDCGGDQYRTAQIIDWIEGPLIAPGDIAYPDGSTENFANCYDPFFGRFKGRTYPVPGNHEYRTPGAAPYFDYFGPTKGTPTAPWYSIDIGTWRIYLLDSNCEIVGCEVGSDQYTWLASQLAKPQPKCTAAVWHHPRWSSSRSGPDPLTSDLYQLLYEHGADVLLTGHLHNYERLTHLSPTGAIDALGIRNFIVGTGGRDLFGFGEPYPGSDVRSFDSHGVLRMELGPAGYRWAFLPTDPVGETDPGWALCN